MNMNVDNKRWCECIKKIPQTGEFELEGIKNWRIYDFKMIPDIKTMHEKSFREEASVLLSAGFNLAFNAEHGVGDVHVLKEGFMIELWQDNKKRKIHKETLDEVLDWIIYFMKKCRKVGEELRE